MRMMAGRSRKNERRGDNGVEAGYLSWGYEQLRHEYAWIDSRFEFRVVSGFEDSSRIERLPMGNLN